MPDTTPKSRPSGEPVAPYGANRDGVTALVIEARLIPGDGTPHVPGGPLGATEAQVDAWIDELSDTVAMTLDGWERLSDTTIYADDGTTVVVLGDRTRLIGAARTIVHNGAASYLEAARHPERATPNDTSYAQVLWTRYEAGLERLVLWLTKRLATPDAGDTGAAEPALGGGIGAFPAPTFGDDVRW